MNLETLRKTHNLTQTQFANMLCLSLRQYQRCEAADYLPKQSAKILSLIMAMNEMHGAHYLKHDCLNVALDSEKIKNFIQRASKKILNKTEKTSHE